MMQIHLDAVGGIAGDMFVAAMIDAFPELEPRVLADAAAAVPPLAGRPQVSRGDSASIACRRFTLQPPLAASFPSAATARPETTFAAMRENLQRIGLSAGTAKQATRILTVLAEAESVIHCVPFDEVHFHELADWDSLLDVVSAGSIIAALGEVSWSVSTLPKGSGLVRTQHGLLPVPAPATTLLLEGYEFRDDGIAGERVTPTGAAILKAIAARSGGTTAGTLTRTGTGGGTRNLKGMPNILRALVFDSRAADEAMQVDSVVVIEFEIDDMTGEEIGTACDQLRAAAGVLDLTTMQLGGKKGRPMVGFRLLVRPEAFEAVAERCLACTSTLGLRHQTSARRTLRREQSRHGETGVKRVLRPGGETTVKAESDDLRGNTLAARRRERRLAEEDDDA